MKSSFDTIIFDLDGTLADTAIDVLEGINRALNQIGLKPITMEYAKQTIGPGKQNFLQSLLPDEAKSDTEKFYTYYRENYWEICTEKTELFFGMREVLTKLNNLILTVASNKPRKFTEKILEKLEIKNQFDVILGPEDVTHEKPHPEMILKILKIFNCKTSRTLFVGDTVGDMMAGQAAGVRLCGVRYGYGFPDEIESQNPDFLIDYPVELLEIVEDGNE